MPSGINGRFFSREGGKANDWASVLATSPSAGTQPALQMRTDGLSRMPHLAHPRFSSHADLLGVMEGRSLTLGAKSDGVTALQNALLDLGFGLPSGADGAFGKELKLAIEGFQSSQDLPLTGELDGKTLRALDAVAPAEGKKAWEDPGLSPDAYLRSPMVKGKPARIVVDTSEHRLFLFDKKGQLERIYPIATGLAGSETDPMIKIVTGFLKDPSAVARRLWPESGGKAFGTRLVDLSKYDPQTGRATRHGEELHGTFTRRSIGTDASHGCMRLYNEDIEDLYGRLAMGDVVVVQK